MADAHSPLGRPIADSVVTRACAPKCHTRPLPPKRVVLHAKTRPMAGISHTSKTDAQAI